MSFLSLHIKPIEVMTQIHLLNQQNKIMQIHIFYPAIYINRVDVL